MTPSSGINRVGLKDRLKDQLVDLRERGLESPRLDDLADLTGVAEVLVLGKSDQLEQVEAALELAIEDYASDPKTADVKRSQETAQLWFGLDSRTRSLDHLIRHERACERWGGIKLSSFRSHRAPKIVGFLARSLVERYDEQKQGSTSKPEKNRASKKPDETTIQEKAVAPEPSQSATTIPRLAKRTRVAASSLSLWEWVLVVVALLLGAAHFALGVWTSSSHLAVIPPPGRVINAADGHIAEHVTTQPSRQLAQIERGDIFRACDLSTEAPCTYPPKHYIPVQLGNVLSFGIRLINPNETPLPYASFLVRHYLANSRVTAQLEVNWPGSHRDLLPPKIVREETLNFGLSQRFDGYVSLVYMPGSTVLTDNNKKFLGHLPNGIMENGIALANIGAPASCFDCSLKFKRYIFFKARIRGRHLG